MPQRFRSWLGQALRTLSVWIEKRNSVSIKLLLIDASQQQWSLALPPSGCFALMLFWYLPSSGRSHFHLVRVGRRAGMNSPDSESFYWPFVVSAIRGHKFKWQSTNFCNKCLPVGPSDQTTTHRRSNARLFKGILFAEASLIISPHFYYSINAFFIAAVRAAYSDSLKLLLRCLVYAEWKYLFRGRRSGALFNSGWYEYEKCTSFCAL